MPASRHSDRSLRQRFRQQRVVCHDAGFQLTGELRDAQRRGEVFLITGKALAKTDYVASQMGGREVFIYFLASRSQPLIVTDILVPRQAASYATCTVDSTETLRVGREARKRGLLVVAGTHSHGHSIPFTSGTDLGQIREFVCESIGWVDESTESLRGEIRPLDGDGGTYQATFPGNPALTLRLAVRRPGATAGDLEVVLQRTCRRTVSSFATTNAFGEHLVPFVETRMCPVCGARSERRIAPADVAVHVIGEVALDESEEDELRRDLEEKIRLNEWWNRTSDWQSADVRTGGWSSTSEPAPVRALPEKAGESDTDAADSLEPYELWRGNKRVATISAAIIEEAASLCSAFRDEAQLD